MKKIICGLVSLLLVSFMGCNKDNKIENYDLSKKGEVEIKSFSKTSVDNDIYTTFQIGGYYSESQVIPTDSVMVYSAQNNGVADQVTTYLKKGFKQVDLMIPNGRDMGCYYLNGSYDGNEHWDIVQKTKEGTYKPHTQGSYYVHPSKGFNDYLVDWCKKAIAAGAKDIYIEEPDAIMDGYCSDYFKSLWKDKYGVNYVYNEDDLEQPSKQNEIIAQMFVDSYDYVSTEIKKTYPTSKVYIATHAIAGYATSIIANNGAMVNLPNIDGVIGQSWSNTSMQPIYFNGGKNKNEFLTSYLEYSELVNLVVDLPNKKSYMLNDASADGGYTYDTTRPVWEHNIVAQMLMPDVYCFESTVWAERAFTNAPNEYKKVQEGIYRIQGDIHNYDSKTYSGTNGIGVLTSYTGASSYVDFSNSLSSLVTPLVSKGIPVDVLTLENIKSLDTLKNIKVLIMSYDFIKPTEEKYSTILSNWVKQGGTIIYVGGYNYMQTFEGNWSSRGFATPQDELFNKLGLDVNSFSVYKDSKELTASSNLPSYFSSTNEFVNKKYTFTSYEIGSKASKLFTSGNKTIAFEQKVNNGNVIVIGVEPVSLSSSETSYENVYEKLIIRACQNSNINYRAPGYMYTVRGEYVFAHSSEKAFKLTGKFIDLFDSGYKIVENPTIEIGQSKAYKRVDTVVGVAFSNSSYEIVSEKSNKVTISTDNIYLSTAGLVYIPESGMIVKSVSASTEQTNMTPENFSYQINDDGSVSINYRKNKKEKVTVEIVLE